MKKITKTVKITGEEKYVLQLLRVLDFIDMMRAGSSRQFTIWYDGDGRPRLRITDENDNNLFKDKNWKLLELSEDKLKFKFD